MNRKLLLMQSLTWATIIAALLSTLLLISGDGVELMNDIGFGAKSAVR